jgi:hypothetical protein
MRAILIVLLGMALHAHAQVFRSVGPDGRPVFSDRPLPNAEQLDLPLSATEPSDSQSAADPIPAASAGFLGPYDMLEIVAPENEHRSRDPKRELPLSLALSPPLMEGHRLVVEVDGMAAEGDLPNSTQILLRDLSLGTHRIRALIQDAEAATVAATPAIQVHLLAPLPATARP